MIFQEFKIAILLLFMVTQSYAHGTERECTPLKSQVFYLVQSGDHLAAILRKFGVDNPLWDSESGYVTQVADKNQIENANLIYRGDKIHLPFSCEESLTDFVLEETEMGRRIIFKFNRDIASVEGVEQNIQMLPEAGKNSLPDQKTPTQLDQDFKSHSALRVVGTYDFHRIDSMSSQSNSEAILLSEPSFGVDLGWEQFWTKQFLTDFNFSYGSVQMRDASSGTLQNANRSLARIGFGVGYLPVPWLVVKFRTSYGNLLFARAVSVGTATLDSVYASRVGVALSPKLLQSGSFSLDLDLGYFEVLASSTTEYSFETGRGYILAPRLSQKLDSTQLELKVEYEDMKQDSSISSQKSKAVGIHFGISFEVGK